MFPAWVCRAHKEMTWRVYLGLALALLPLPLVADDVYLTGDRVFEDVIASVTETHLEVRTSIGTLRFPLAQLVRVDREETALARYEARRKRLEPSGDAEAWLELARFARRAGLDRGHREAALMAAELDPELADLSAELEPLGYLFEESLGRWLKASEVMRRRGLVNLDGRWVEPSIREAALAERRQAWQESQTRSAHFPAEVTGSREHGSPTPSGNEVALAQVDLLRDILVERDRTRELGGERASPVPWGRAAGSALIRPLIGPFGFVAFGGSLGFGQSREAADTWDALSVRQPGSLIPVSYFRQQRSR